MSIRYRSMIGTLLLGASFLTTRADDPPKPEEFSPKWFKLPAGNRIKANQKESRVYKLGEDGTTKLSATEQAEAGYPKILTEKQATEYIPSADEVMEYHGGIDVTSRLETGARLAQEFSAGVYGKVIQADPKDPIGRVVIEVDDRGNTVEFVHMNKMYLSPGSRVTPDTVMGLTGTKGASMFHLHVQARNKNGRVLNAAEVVAYARRPPEKRPVSAWFAPVRTSYTAPSDEGDGSTDKSAVPKSSPTDDPRTTMTKRIMYLDSAVKGKEGREQLVYDETAKIETKLSGCRGRAKQASEDRTLCEKEAKELAERKSALQERESKLKERRAELEKEKLRLQQRKKDFSRTKRKLDKAARKKALDELNQAIDDFAEKTKGYDQDVASLRKDTADLNKEITALKKKGQKADIATAAAAQEEKQLAARQKLLALKKNQIADELKALQEERKQVQEELKAEKAKVKQAEKPSDKDKE